MIYVLQSLARSSCMCTHAHLDQVCCRYAAKSSNNCLHLWIASSISQQDMGVSADSRMSKYDFSGEKIHWEGPPHRGDIAVNLALGTTLLWLPLTIASVTRGAFVNFIFSDKRLSVVTTAPWKSRLLASAFLHTSLTRLSS